MVLVVAGHVVKKIAVSKSSVRVKFNAMNAIPSVIIVAGKSNTTATQKAHMKECQAICAICA